MAKTSSYRVKTTPELFVPPLQHDEKATTTRNQLYINKMGGVQVHIDFVYIEKLGVGGGGVGGGVVFVLTKLALAIHFVSMTKTSEFHIVL